MGIINKMSLKLKMIVMVNAIVLVFGAISLSLFQYFKSEYQEDLYKSFQNYSENISHALQDQYFERYGDVQAFALNEFVIAMDKENLPKVFDEYVKLYGLYDLILFVDKDGKYISSNSKDVSGQNVKIDVIQKLNYAQTPWFKKAINGEFTGDKANGFVGTLFEDAQMDPIKKLAFGENRIGVSFTSLVKNSKGEVIGVLTNRSSLKWIEDVVKRSYEQMKSKGFPHSEITLIDKTGVILVSHDPHLNGDKNEVVYDFEKVNFKLNLVENKLKAAEEIMAGKKGFTEEFHIRKKIFQLNAYTTVIGTKIPDSIRWGVIVRAEKDELLAHIYQIFNLFYIVFGVTLVSAFVLTMLFSNRVSSSLNKISELLNSNADSLNQTSSELTIQSTRLSESSTEQASAIQETMAAVDEISATVEKNTEAARQSKSVSSLSMSAAVSGKEIVGNLLTSIDEISNSNDSIADQMKQNNEKINEIVKLITDIGNKTKVINEIVFQTKLLSFNASVEAARAGEYGKGFAVVAEEVGNLAQMSGNAAKEISSLLDESQRKTSQIVKETESRVNELISHSHQKIEAGKKTASECNDALEEITKNVRSVDEMVSEISRASEEQSNGIKEIAKAMGQLDITTSENSKISQESSTSSINVNRKSEELKKQVVSLVSLVKGEGDSQKLMTPQVVSHKKKAQVITSDSVMSEKKSNNVMAFSKKRMPSVKPTEQSATNKASVLNSEAVPHKAVSGDSVPSSNDPRFEEV